MNKYRKFLLEEKKKKERKHKDNLSISLKRYWRMKKKQDKRTPQLSDKFSVYNSKVSYGKDEYGRLKVLPAEAPKA